MLELMIRAIPPILLLVLGVIIYWLFRPEIYLFQFIQISNPAPLGTHDSLFLLFLKNHSADAVWCLALLLSVRLLQTSDIPRGYILALLSLPFVSELLQGTPLIPGTFDWIDLAIYLALYATFFHREIIEMNNTLKHIIGVLALTTFVAGIVGSTNPPARKSSTKSSSKPVKTIEYTTGTFKIPAAENEYFTKKSLGRILKTSSTPSIVLRVPVAGKNVTQESKQKNNVLYNIIEKEFAKSGFAVRDRLVGAYTFHYTPCTFACTHKFNTKVRRTLTVDKTIPTDFFKNAAKRLITELQKVK